MRLFSALSLILSLVLVSSAIAAQQQGAAAPTEQIYLESEVLFDEVEQLAIDRDGILVTGTVQSFYQNGRLAWETQWVAGRLNGVTRGYHENRNLKEETTWVGGKMHGPARWYDEDGKLIRETMYENDRDLAAPAEAR